MTTDNNKFSIFPKGYRNQKGQAVLATRPQQAQDIAWAYDYITSVRAQWATETLRSMLETATKDELSDFKKSFQTMQQHVAFHYGIAIDKSGSDVCRACFLPHDPECYINPIYFIR